MNKQTEPAQVQEELDSGFLKNAKHLKTVSNWGTVCLKQVTVIFKSPFYFLFYFFKPIFEN